jgi:AraC-like DNA-binding protein
VSEGNLADASAEISLFQQVRQIENVSALHGPGWAFSQPDLWSASAHGALGVAMLAAPTIRDSLEVLSRYGHVRAPFFQLRLRPRRDDMALDYELTVALAEAQWRPMMEIAFISVRRLVQASLGREPSEMRFSFAAPRPAYDAEVRAALGAHVGYGAATNEVVLPSAWLHVPSTAADATLHRRALAELAAARARLDDPADLRARVERLLQTMPERRLGADDVARALGVSRRTLTRRLGDAGTQFRDLLDAELRARAERLLAEGRSRDEVAERLGYSDPTSLSRACRRWFRDA